MKELPIFLGSDIRNLSSVCHERAMKAGWWGDLDETRPVETIKNKVVRLALVITEISEAIEGVRKDAMDEHLPHRTSEEVELADAVIRIFDYAGGYDIDLGTAVLEKLEYNSRRQDHKPENRQKKGGKKV